MLRTDFEAIFDLPITGDQMLVMFALLKFRNGRTGQCNPHKETIARELKKKERWVYKMLEELKRAGHVDVVQLGGGRGRTTNYRLNLYGEARGENSVHPNTVSNPVYSGNSVRNPVRFDNRNKEEVFNTKNTGERRFPPSTAIGGANAKSRLDRAIANIDRVCGK